MANSAPRADIALFLALVCSGAFYPELARFAGLDPGYVKRRFLVDVLAKDGRYPSRVEQTFRKLFPSVFEFVKAVNRDQGTLIRLLQRMEAWLVIEQVAPRLLGRVPCVTLHDATYTQRDKVAAVEAAFRETFEEIGFSMALKRE